MSKQHTHRLLILALSVLLLHPVAAQNVCDQILLKRQIIRHAVDALQILETGGLWPSPEYSLGVVHLIETTQRPIQERVFVFDDEYINTIRRGTIEVLWPKKKPNLDSTEIPFQLAGRYDHVEENTDQFNDCAGKLIVGFDPFIANQAIGFRKGIGSHVNEQLRDLFPLPAKWPGALAEALNVLKSSEPVVDPQVLLTHQNSIVHSVAFKRLIKTRKLAKANLTEAIFANNDVDEAAVNALILLEDGSIDSANQLKESIAEWYSDHTKREAVALAAYTQLFYSRPPVLTNAIAFTKGVDTINEKSKQDIKIHQQRCKDIPSVELLHSMEIYMRQRLKDYPNERDETLIKILEASGITAIFFAIEQ